MGRNKFPEETEKLIIKTAQKLFLENGYDHTSIQEIINQLGGLSKGAIYHHFKSKEDILIKLLDEMSKSLEKTFTDICRDKSKSGLEKLKALMKQSYQSADSTTAFLSAPNLTKNPKMLTMQVQSIFEEIVPVYIQPVIQEGIADGSIQTDYPRELAEIIIVLGNLWLNPMMFAEKSNRAEMLRRVELYRMILESLGLYVVDDEMIQDFGRACDVYYKGLRKKSAGKW